MRPPSSIASDLIAAYHNQTRTDWRDVWERVIAAAQAEAKAEGRAEALEEAASYVGGLADSDQFGGTREQPGLYLAAIEIRAHRRVRAPEDPVSAGLTAAEIADMRKRCWSGDGLSPSAGERLLDALHAAEERARAATARLEAAQKYRTSSIRHAWFSATTAPGPVGPCVCNECEDGRAYLTRDALTPPAAAPPAPRGPVPVRDIVFAEPVEGSDGGYLVTLNCGHKLATRNKRVSYPCHECMEPAAAEPREPCPGRGRSGHELYRRHGGARTAGTAAPNGRAARRTSRWDRRANDAAPTSWNSVSQTRTGGWT